MCICSVAVEVAVKREQMQLKLLNSLLTAKHKITLDHLVYLTSCYEGGLGTTKISPVDHLQANVGSLLVCFLLSVNIPNI
mmetsp:Transcript_11658/g.18940  ORF Transcript_11658/g.18940 Transcript_11658/m.18940 type:complete len:80 (-) Transcript_11658:101-340(-)